MDSRRLDRAKPFLLDLSLIAAVAVFLALVHFLLPAQIQQSLAFRFDLSEPWTLLTSAYLHADDQHLVDNLLGFLPASLMAYLLCVQANERRWFRRTFVALLLVLPILVHLTDYAIFALRFPRAEPVSRGFSGVAAGFVGFLFVALLALVRTAYSRWTVFLFGQLVILGLLVEIYVIYAGAISPTVAGAAAVGAAAIGIGLVHENWNGVAAVRTDWTGTLLRAVQVGLVVLLLVTFTYQLFPAEVVQNGSFVNVFAHGSGIVFGVLLSGLIQVTLSRRTARDA